MLLQECDVNHRGPPRSSSLTGPIAPLTCTHTQRALPWPAEGAGCSRYCPSWMVGGKQRVTLSDILPRRRCLTLLITPCSLHDHSMLTSICARSTLQPLMASQRIWSGVPPGAYLEWGPSKSIRQAGKPKACALLAGTPKASY